MAGLTWQMFRMKRLLFCDDLHSLVHGLHIERYEVVMAFGKGFEESLVESVGADDRAYLEQSAENNHVEHL